jgi:hypothetical protein
MYGAVVPAGAGIADADVTERKGASGGGPLFLVLGNAWLAN